MTPSRHDLLSIFRSNTGRSTITPRPMDQSIHSLCGFTPHFPRDFHDIRAPVPDFRPSGFEGVDADLLGRLGHREQMRVERGRRGSR